MQKIKVIGLADDIQLYKGDHAWGFKVSGEPFGEYGTMEQALNRALEIYTTSPNEMHLTLHVVSAEEIEKR